MPAPMMPQTSVNSTGAAAAGTPNPLNNAAIGPLTIVETGQTFLRTTRAVTLKDAVASTAAGAALTNQHCLRIAIGNAGNIVFLLFSQTLSPGSANRHVPAVSIEANVDVYFSEVQLSGAGAEANYWVLFWA